MTSGRVDAMRVYYFDFHDHSTVRKDREGQTFGTLQEAAREARACLFEIYSEYTEDCKDFTISFNVMNELGELAHKASLSFKAESFDLGNGADHAPSSDGQGTQASSLTTLTGTGGC